MVTKISIFSLNTSNHSGFRRKRSHSHAQARHSPLPAGETTHITKRAPRDLISKHPTINLMYHLLGIWLLIELMSLPVEDFLTLLRRF